VKQWICVITGMLILISVELGYFHHRCWLFFNAFAGNNLLPPDFYKMMFDKKYIRETGCGQDVLI